MRYAGNFSAVIENIFPFKIIYPIRWKNASTVGYYFFASSWLKTGVVCYGIFKNTN